MFQRYFNRAFNFGIPLAAVAMLTFAMLAVTRSKIERVEHAPPFAPAHNEYERAVAATGLIEPNTENIAIGSQKAGVVRVVAVRVNDHVAAGDPLFQIDDSEERAQRAVAQRRLDIARAQLAELERYPRPEEVPPADARVAAAAAMIVEAEARLADQQRELRFFQDAARLKAATQDELQQRQYAVQIAEANVQAMQARHAEAIANLELLRAGTFAPRLEAARAEVAQAEADVARIQATIDLLTIRAPVNGTILQVNVRAGEFAAAGVLATPLMIMGSTEPLHVRVSVDEVDAVRVRAGAPATAYIRGDARYHAPLAFVRFEPLVIPKRSLTGAVGERVDTRVLQVIYKVDPADFPVYVGQQVDVYIKEDAVFTGAFAEGAH